MTPRKVSHSRHGRVVYQLFLSDLRRLMSTSLTILTLTTIFAICISAQSINFEAPTYVLGNINGQDGWSKTGPYDVFVSSSGGTAGFGAQSLRISNGVTSDSFGDQAFSKSNPNEAGNPAHKTADYRAALDQTILNISSVSHQRYPEHSSRAYRSQSRQTAETAPE